MSILALRGITPQVAKSARVANDAVLVGDVRVGDDSVVWFGCVARADFAPILIASRVFMGPRATVEAISGHSTVLGDDVTLGPLSVVHGASIGAVTTVGARAVVLTDARIGSRCHVLEGSVVPEGTVIQDGSLVGGIPAVVLRPLTSQEHAKLADAAANARRSVHEILPLA